MTKDQSLSRRRVLLTGTALLGAATTARLFTMDRSTAGQPTAGPQAASPPRPAPGPHAHQRLRPAAYRLQPLLGYGPPAARRTRTAIRSKPFVELSGRARTLVLTFDDGPDPRYTPEILRILRVHRVRAMFFVCGQMVRAHPDLLRAMADDGHIVGNHTWSHPLLPELSRSAIRAELERTSEAVMQAYGAWPVWFRAPYGAWNKATFRIGADLGMEPLGWNVDSLDWQSPGTGAIIARVADHAAPGAIVLSHDAGGDRSQTVRALREYLPRLLSSGYRITVPRTTAA